MKSEIDINAEAEHTAIRAVLYERMAHWGTIGLLLAFLTITIAIWGCAAWWCIMWIVELFV